MTPKSIRFLLWLAIAQSVLPAHAANPVNKTEQRIELLESQFKALDDKTQLKLEANEKLVQAKVDQAAALAQNLENGRKDVDWWLNATALFLAMAGVLAVVIPVMLQRRQRQAFEAEVRNIRDTFATLQAFERQTKDDMRQAMAELHEMERAAKEQSQAIQAAVDKAKADSDSIEERLKNIQIQDKSPEQLRDLAAEARAADHTPISKLLTKAFEYAETEQWAESAVRWRSLTDLEPESASHWFNLGYVLLEQADADVANKPGLIQQACMAYAEAVRIKPDKHEAYHNWGAALAAWARSLEGEARQAKFAEACDKYAEAVRIKPDMHKTYNNWGAALAAWARSLEGEAKAAKLREVKNVLMQAEALQAGAGAYNLACVAALFGQPDEAREWLNKARQAGTLAASDCEHLQTDSDLDSLRGLPWFTEYLAEVCGDKQG
ncbi:MAG: hypothetical protein HY850_09005 [Betaproteobacteria bacterium]|nr:hypothetical protein [Betaproteobacteria bacterium]